MLRKVVRKINVTTAGTCFYKFLIYKDIFVELFTHTTFCAEWQLQEQWRSETFQLEGPVSPLPFSSLPYTFPFPPFALPSLTSEVYNPLKSS